MQDTGLHYLTYDPDAILTEMMQAYVDAGGDVIYGGDEKEMLLRAVQAVIVQAFAGVDNALRMGTLRYAVGDYLDAIGETRMCERIAATSATAMVSIVENGAASSGDTIASGSIITVDGQKLYTLDEDVTLTGVSGAEHSVGVTCTVAGETGNGLLSGTSMQFVIAQSGVKSVSCTVSSSGGADEEDDDDYRDRIRTAGALNVTTGPSAEYEAVAESVSSLIIDAKAVNGGAGIVNVYLILDSGATASAVISEVKTALNDKTVRPLTDTVDVLQATDIEYTINVEYYGETGVDISDAVDADVEEYQKFQDNTIGQAFNPDRLMALLYQSGCTRVTWGSGSAFGGGSVTYTEIENSQRCKGTITVTRMN